MAKAMKVKKQQALMARFQFKGQAYACTRVAAEKLQREADYIISLSEHGLKQQAYGACWGLYCSIERYRLEGQLAFIYSSSAELQATGS